MARIVGVDLPRDKRVEIGLTYIFGWDVPAPIQARRHRCGTPTPVVRDLSEAELVALRDYIEANYQTEGDCAARCRPTSGARSRSGPIRACATAAVSRAWTAHPPTRVPARARSPQEEGRQVSIRAGV